MLHYGRIDGRSGGIHLVKLITKKNLWFPQLLFSHGLKL